MAGILTQTVQEMHMLIKMDSILALKGMILLWSTAMFPEARPPPCIDHGNNCSPSTTSQLALLCSSFILMAIGAGGIRGTSLAFGTDQIDKQEDGTNIKDNEGILASYIGWYYAASAISSLVGITCFAYLQEHFGWKIGFGIPVACMFVPALSFFLASTFYIKLKAKASLLIGLVQVIVASSDGRALNSWRLCTVDQVEELKALLNIIPMWSTGILFSINSSQITFSTIQVKSMDRHVTSSFEIPAGSFGMFTILSVVIWLVLYQYAILLMILLLRRVATTPPAVTM